MSRKTQDFQTIRSEGGLLPSDLLRRILDPRSNLPGTTPENYGLPPGERLNDIITQSWNRLRKHWSAFSTVVKNQAQPEPEDGAAALTGLTNDKWTLPLLRELGFGLLPTSAGPEVGGRTYPISRFFGPVPIHLIGCGLSLDRRAAGQRGAAAVNPHGLVQDFLNRSEGHLWAILSNGKRLRILRDNQSLSRQSYLEYDLEAMFDGEVFSDFAILWLTAHATRFMPEQQAGAEGGGKPADVSAASCWLEKWTKEAEEQGARALESLKDSVVHALQTLGEGFTSHPRNTALRDALRNGELKPADFHGQLLRVIYRLIFLFVAEDRTLDGISLLHIRETGENETDLEACYSLYASHYSTARLREMAGKIKGSRHGDLWEQFNLIVGALSGGEQFAEVRNKLALPTFGSFLWDPSATSSLNAGILSGDQAKAVTLSNHDFLEALRHLAFIRQGRILRPVDYRNIGAEELGGIYESLLELTPQISADGARFAFAEFSGNERKTSGSYYTPDSLVQCLLDSALDPVVNEALKGKTGDEAEKALLALKVCDPAVGSGHFLVAAAHRLARHLARVRALAQGESEPSPLLYQHALRDVIGRCLYGVDINPMAAELCRVSLWLEALDPGKPLSFLDHHIQCGNSLIGATPGLMARGIPDDAFIPIQGDDKKYCAEFKKINKSEARNQEGLAQATLFDREDRPWHKLGNLAAAMVNFDNLPDNTPADIQAKEKQYYDLIRGAAYASNQQLADAWCAAFVWKKCKPADGGFDYPITNEMFQRLERNPFDAPVWMRDEIKRLAGQYKFFHWHLAFPDVFQSEEQRAVSGEQRAEDLRGWRGGFDVILGNPPWEKTTLIEQEYFAETLEIVNEQRSNKRKHLIAELQQTNPQLHAAWGRRQREANACDLFYAKSARYSLAGVGELNLFSLFSELVSQLVNNTGHFGIIVKSSLLLSPTWAAFTKSLVETGKLRYAFDFRNWKGWFPNIGFHERFTLLHVGPSRTDNPEILLGFYFDDPADANTEKLFRLSSADLISLNPITKTLPVFESQRSQNILLHIYRRFPVLSSPASGWHLVYTTGFHMTSEAEKLRTKEELEAQGALLERGKFILGADSYLPLMEGKLLHQYDPRFATFRGVPTHKRFGRKAPTFNPSYGEKADPFFCTEPRYWISLSDATENLLARKVDFGQAFAFRDTTNVISNFRTAVGGICGEWCFNYKAPNLVPAETSSKKTVRMLLWCALFNSVPFDFAVRQKFFGANLIKSILDQLAVPPFVSLQDRGDFIFSRSIELTYTAWDLEPFARDCGYDGSPFRWDEDRRYEIRCELDAAFFHLYLPTEANGEWKLARKSDGCPHDETPEQLAELKKHFPTPRHAVDYIMDTFPIVKRKDEEKFGEYRTKKRILEIYDAMAAVMKANSEWRTANGKSESDPGPHSYQTRLNPPPGPPSDADGNFLPLPEWKPGQPKPTDWPPHIHPPRGCEG